MFPNFPPKPHFMAKFSSGINGPFRGKVGTVVGVQQRNGETHMRSAPSKRTSKRKVNEKANQTKFSMVHKWLQPLLDFVRVGFKGYSEKAEGFNAAKSYVLRNAVKNENGVVSIDPSLVQLSHGDLPLPSHISVTQQPDKTLLFEWDPHENGGDRYDQIMVVLYNLKTRQAICHTTGQFRHVGREILNFSGKGCHIYVAFSAHDRKRQSHSVYLGLY
jgi:hypothetical protein